MQRVFDEVNDRLRVDANVTAVIDNIVVNVDLDASSDNIAIKDESTGYALVVNADGSINVNVTVSAADGDNIAIKDSDGDELEINSDGSINVNLVHSYDAFLTKNIYTEISGVASGSETTISNYTIPAGKIGYLSKVEFSGDQIEIGRAHV